MFVLIQVHIHISAYTYVLSYRVSFACICLPFAASLEFLLALVYLCFQLVVLLFQYSLTFVFRQYLTDISRLPAITKILKRLYLI